MNEFERARRFIEGLEEASATRVQAFAHGRGFFHEDLPIVWDLNFVRVEREPDSWPQLRDEVEELQRDGGLSHRKIHLRDEEWVPALCDEARGDGWEVTSLVFMVRTAPSGKPDRGRAREVSYADVRGLREGLARRQPWAHSEDDVRQVLAANRAWMKRAEGRCFAVECDGKLVAAADLYRGAGLWQIEDVETLREYRGRGFATDAVLGAAATAERIDPEGFVFLVADESDWPKRLYERLGFATVGRKHSLLKLPK